MGPEIFIAFFAFLGMVFWLILRFIWRLLIFFFNVFFVPFSLLNNYIRVKFWGLPKKKIQNNIFKKSLF